jgi:hypothetical protein
MPASAVFVMDLNGNTIISRDYRGDIPMHNVEKFTKRIGMFVSAFLCVRRPSQLFVSARRLRHSVATPAAASLQLCAHMH